MVRKNFLVNPSTHKIYDWMAGKSSFKARNGKSSSQPRVGKMKLFINGKKYRIHPRFNLYGGNKYGEVINISRFTPMKRNDHNSGYLKLMVRGSGDRKFSNVFVHRFIYECYYGVIPEGMVIDHINDDRKDNRLCNLQLLTPQQNSKKAMKKYGHSLSAENFKNKKRIKAFNLESNKTTYYDSMNAAQRSLGIDHSTVKRCCLGIHKSSTSKLDGCRYTFEFA